MHGLLSHTDSRHCEQPGSTLAFSAELISQNAVARAKVNAPCPTKVADNTNGMGLRPPACMTCFDSLQTPSGVVQCCAWPGVRMQETDASKIKQWRNPNCLPYIEMTNSRAPGAQATPWARSPCTSYTTRHSAGFRRSGMTAASWGRLPALTLACMLVANANAHSCGRLPGLVRLSLDLGNGGRLELGTDCSFSVFHSRQGSHPIFRAALQSLELHQPLAVAGRPGRAISACARLPREQRAAPRRLARL